ncbi:MAG: VWA domain-containing protein, partial [Hyphomicrobiales bacterium]|nr:VWA domain-containing protein [Hyphomicrobiales bacterium]
MTDDIKEFERALANEPLPEPGRGAKKRALDLAMAAFDEKNANTHQGSGPLDRLKDTAWAVYETLIGRRSMKLTPAFAGGASLAVLTLAVLSATYIQTTGPDFGIGRQTAPTQLPPRAAGRDDKAASNVQPKTIMSENEAAPQRTAKKEHDRLARSELKDRQVTAQEPRIMAAPPAAETFSGLATSKAPRARASRDQAGVRRLVVKPKQDRPAGTYYRDQGRDKFETITQNPVKRVSEEPVSTFSIDVDTASYAFVRASLNNNVLPQKDAVRVEEMINYFPYDYAKPDDRAVPFKASVSVLPSPWKAGRKLVHIGIAGFELKRAERPRSNLVFLLDTSGSMNAPNKLPLVINSMKLLLDSLGPDDTVAIVTYAGNAGTVLEPTRVKEKAKILQAFNNLHAGGSTAGAEGIRQAYELAKQNVKKDGVNRVILATDGDFNVGITNREELKSYVERQRKTGISLSVLGFGRGNYNDALMQTLAQNGNGNAAYIDTLNEARKVLVEEAGSTLFTIAKDVKLQLEFNPQAVSEYRLIGYETRLLNREDFNNDKVDAGDI